MPFHVTCICGQQLVVPDERSGEVIRCAQCDRELAIPTVQAPLPPPVPMAEPDDEQSAIVVDTTIESRAKLRVDRDRHTVQTIGWSLVLLALLSAVPVAIAMLRPPAPGSIQLERWALGILLLGVVQLSYAVYLLQLPDWSSARVVSIVTLGIATLYAIAAGMRMLASPGNRAMESLELDGNLFSSRQEVLWCFAMVLLTGTLSYFAGRASTQWAGRSPESGVGSREGQKSDE